MNDTTIAEPWMRRTANPKLDRIMISPEGVPLNVTVAAAGARAGALALDIIIILIPTLASLALLRLLILVHFFVAS